MRGGPLSLADAPQWLVSAFVRSAVAVGATAERAQIQRTARDLVARWQAPERSFHNLRHLIDVLARVEELAEETHVPDVVRLAAWYHGAVFNASPQVAYARRGGEDEVASAELARRELGELGVPSAVTERVHELITNLERHDADEHDVDALALCDADLGTLAVEPQRYAAYRRAIRQEYAHIPERDYVVSRIAILSRLLKRRRLFVSPFSLSWEEPARENLTAELSHLRSRLAELGGTEEAPADEPTRPRVQPATSWPGRGPVPVPGTAGAEPSGDTSAGRAAPTGRAAPSGETAAARSVGTDGAAQPGQAPVGRAAATDGAAPSGATPASRTAATDPAAPSGEARASHSAGGGPRPDGSGATEAPASAASPTRSPDEDVSRATAAPPRRPADEEAAEDGGQALSGIEREPEFDHRRRGRGKRRRERSAAQRPDEVEPSPSALFRPPPKLPRS